MSPLRAVLLLTLAASASLAAVVRITAYDIGADQPHGPLTRALLEALRERSVANGAQYVSPPSDLSDPERVQRGAGHYETLCVGCHLAPGRADSAIRKGLYPQPQNLALAGHGSSANDAERSAARQFWIIQHGIKMTGMPAWSAGGMDSQSIWDVVALLQLLPSLSPEEYAALVDASGAAAAGADTSED